MNEKYKITIIDSHISDGDETGTEITTFGDFYGDENDYTVKYIEKGEGLAGSETSIRVIDKTRIELMRRGVFNTEMIIEKGRRHNSVYTTPYGTLNMGVYAQSVESNVNSDGGELRFSYTIDFNSSGSTENTLIVRIKEI